MAWWRKRQATRAGDFDGATERKPQPAAIPAPREPEAGSSPDDRWDLIKRDLLALDPDFFTDLSNQGEELDNDLDRPATTPLAGSSRELNDDRLIQSMRRLSIRYLVDEAGAFLAMWERHVVQIRREGPGGEILVLRARAYATIPAEWDDRALRAINEWNRTRRFLKAYLGEPTETGNLPLYGETQIPLRPGVTDALLDEFIDCAAAVAGAYVDWLHDEAGVL